MRNPLDRLVIWLLRRKMRKHGYSEMVINIYTRGRPH